MNFPEYKPNRTNEEIAAYDQLLKEWLQEKVKELPAPHLLADMLGRELGDLVGDDQAYKIVMRLYYTIGLEMRAQ